MKSTVKEIQERFDADVERFSNLYLGQQSTIDSVLNMELIAEGITRTYPKKIKLLDIGCGAGNYTIKLLTKKKDVAVDLLDLSEPMLARAVQRINSHGPTAVKAYHGDFRTVNLPGESYDVIIATSVLHHLREDADWSENFSKIFRLLADGGSLWVFDLVKQNSDELQDLIYSELYGQYLAGLDGEQYREKVFSYIEKEDTPRPLIEQLDLLRRVGFKSVDILHKNLSFASFVAYK
ncbi:class I SAM-dependent methyltransferase [Sphingobacterium sp. JB170]|uniref:class I SAM-dependent methyltransferase n=1 Tax=Sphingobacterium sp. JB170 TaxID=1434842 RepID=UPI00097F331D|nr:class I SAM-dependent methyltransferase [Sphingobacterium sp. JB170]SJN39067.1 Methyltransferase type 11 [Sphingobacterium sp. JB170]